jgi:hypothetical protein
VRRDTVHKSDSESHPEIFHILLVGCLWKEN